MYRKKFRLPSEPLEQPETIPERNLSGWRKRFLDEHGNPLPPDPVRIDVKTGQRVEDTRVAR
jgi:hypothetical protein